MCFPQSVLRTDCVQYREQVLAVRSQRLRAAGALRSEWDRCTEKEGLALA